MVAGSSSSFFFSLESMECSFWHRITVWFREASAGWSQFWLPGSWRTGQLFQRPGRLHQGRHKKGIQNDLLGPLDAEIPLMYGVYTTTQAVSMVLRVQRGTDMLPNLKMVSLQGWGDMSQQCGTYPLINSGLGGRENPWWWPQEHS